MIFREVLWSGFEYCKKLTLTDVCSLDRDKVSNICKCHWSEKSLDYGKMDFISNFLYFSSQLELKTQQTQFRGGGKREKKFLLLPPLQRKRLPYMTKYIYMCQDPIRTSLCNSSFSIGMFYLCRDKENCDYSAFRAKGYWISKQTLEESM